MVEREELYESRRLRVLEQCNSLGIVQEQTGKLGEFTHRNKDRGMFTPLMLEPTTGLAYCQIPKVSMRKYQSN